MGKGSKRKANARNRKYRNELLNFYYAHFDESQIKVNGNSYNEVCASNDKYTRMWKKEWMKDENNPLYDDERSLLERMEDLDKEQILYFLKDFKVPTTNNQVEVDQRNIKIKKKIGKFRSEAGVEIYVIIRSCINKYKKYSINVYSALIKAFKDEPIIA